MEVHERSVRFLLDRSAQDACEVMLELALERGGLDNVTVIVVRLLAARPRSSEPTKSPVTLAPEWRP